MVLFRLHGNAGASVESDTSIKKVKLSGKGYRFLSELPAYALRVKCCYRSLRLP